MDTKIQRLRSLLDRFLYKSKNEVRTMLGPPSKRSDAEIWFYSRYRMLVYKYEIALVFEKERVVDIMVTEYFLWKGINNIFYYQGQEPEFKVMSLLKWRKHSS